MKKPLLCCLLIAGVFTGFIPKTKKNSSPPNILMIEVDDLTAKYLGCFGADFAHTPCVDELAATGVVFDNAVTQAAMCTPSRNSLITALYPHNLGLYHNLDLEALPRGIWTFPKELQKQGYATFWVGKNHLIPNMEDIGPMKIIDRKNLALKQEMGFDDVYQSFGRSMISEKAKKDCQTEAGWVEGFDAYGDFLFENNLLDRYLEEVGDTPSTLDPDTEYIDGHCTTIAIDKMARYQEKKPFLMWVNFSGPHHPFNAPESFQNQFLPENMPIPIGDGMEPTDIPDDFRPLKNPYDLRVTSIYRKRYSANVAYMDSQVGRLLDFIRSSRFADNTVIVFFSDHGLMTGDHCAISKETLYKEVINPALIIQCPKKFPAKRVSKAMELLDLAKTFLDLAEAPEASLRKVPHGHSLLPLLKGNDGFTGSGYGFSEVGLFRSLFNGDYKYVDHPETPILFNLKEDPDETQNRMEQEPEMAAALKQLLGAWLAATPPVLPAQKQVHIGAND